jgi:membrane-bound lytic murein transglycosylase F
LGSSDAIYIPSSLLTQDELADLKDKYRNVVTFNGLNTGLLVEHLQMKRRSCAIVQSSVAEAISLKYSGVHIEEMNDFGSNSWYVSSKNSFLLDLNKWIAETRNSANHSSYYSSFYQNYKVNRALSSGVNLTGEFFLSEYDEVVKNFSSKIGWDWLLISSLIYQESQFKPSVVSSRGAKGLMQVMPETANQFGYHSVHSASTNIYIGTRLLSRLARIFSKYPIGIEEQRKFVLAAYNGGIGRVLDAMRITAKYGRNPYNWEDVSIFFLRKNPSLVNPHKVKNENETTRFVKEVLERYYNYKALSLS